MYLSCPIDSPDPSLLDQPDSLEPPPLSHSSSSLAVMFTVLLKSLITSSSLLTISEAVSEKLLPGRERCVSSPDPLMVGIKRFPSIQTRMTSRISAREVHLTYELYPRVSLRYMPLRHDWIRERCTQDAPARYINQRAEWLH